ncbi:MAG: P-type DNA transfer ATPase VirB11 [Sedimentibacter sp.]
MNAELALDKGLVLKNLLRMGGIYDLIEMEGLTEIWVNKPQQAYIETYEGREEKQLPKLTFEFLLKLANAFAVFNATHITKSNPIVNGTFPTGERAQVVIPPAVPDGTISITIRKPSRTRLSIQDYVDSDKFSGFVDVTKSIQEKKAKAKGIEIQLDELGVPSDVFLNDFELEMLKAKKVGDVPKFLDLAVKNKLNIVFVGATGSGKTTITKAVINDYLPKDTRVITIEDTAELELPYHDNHVHLFYGEHATPKELIKSCMRMKPDRIFLTELRGDETWDYLSLLNTGHNGSITTVHANSAYDAYTRIATLIKQSEIGITLDYDFILREVKTTLDVVVMFKKHRLTELYFNPVEKYKLTNIDQV